NPSHFAGGVSINQLEREPKPGSGPGGRPFGTGGAAPIGGLFANGLPSKPSDNKIRRAHTTAITPIAPPPPHISKQASEVSTRPSPSNHVAAPPAPPKPSELLTANKPSPPPPPVQSKNIASGTNNREQFKTMRPFKPEMNYSNSKMRRSGSSEDVSSRESTPARAPLARPSFHPPARPTAPPPPPPIVRTNGFNPPDPPPTPSVGPVTSGLTS
ncbi:unnamed protein product, partial [Strongylus vulgaris]